MVSTNKGTYMYEQEFSTSEEESCEDTDYIPSNNKSEFPVKKSGSRAGRKPKCFSKNALLARENRLKKKMYISNLESDVTCLRKQNKKLTSVVDNQSYMIADLKKQVKYFKSIIANSSDISKLIRNIHQSTGMSVSSSLENNLSLNNVCVPKQNLNIARKTAHPWEETCYPSYPTPESNSLSSSDALRGDGLTGLLNDIPLTDFPLDITEEDLIDGLGLKNEIFDTECTVSHDEHNYTAKEAPDDDVGVCLHVSKHRVSLEFCPSCSENAVQSWLN